MDESEILARLNRRDETALTALAQIYSTYCYAIALNVLGRAEDAEECVNDTWLRVWQNVPPDQPRSISAYAGAITRRLAINRWHAQRASCRDVRLTTSLDELDSLLHQGDTVSEAITHAELVAVLDQFLGRLPTEQRVMFVRRYWNMDSIAAIAAHLHMREGTVRVKLHRLRNQLRDELERRNLL